MESLLANYASSDEEELEGHDRSEKADNPSRSASKLAGNSPSSSFKYSDSPKNSPSFFSSLTLPKSSSSSSSLFSFLPPPKSHTPNPSQTLTNLSSSKPIYQQQEEKEEKQQQSQRKEAPKFPSKFSSVPEPKSSSSSIFSSLPQPKSHNADPFSLTNLPSTPDPNPKKVVQLKLPLNPSLMKSRGIEDEDKDEDDDNEREGKKSRESLTQTFSVKSFLSSIPAPKNLSTLGSLPSAAGSGRRSILEADAPSLNSNDFHTETEVGVYRYDMGGSADYAAGSGSDTSSWVSSSANYGNYDGYAVYGNYDHAGEYDSNGGDGSTTMTMGTDEIKVNIPGKRGRKEIPHEIVEVKQDELIKNRPREDQAKLTGIAFGPSYQPVSTKGKPSKLHKRKHQIGSLFYDMKQKEMELAERRSKGFLTKAETQAKYGW
ncbi:hypothetical protein U1Q18_033718 [Sarracenia purpurea var. burkii]